MTANQKGERSVRVAGVSKRYRRVAAGYKFRTLKSALLGGALTGGLRDEDTIEALRAVDFEVGRGEAFGVIGGNGSGKSTLLKLISGLLPPTAGTIDVRGRLAAMIELGAGFHPEISGRENVFINGSVLGLTRRQVRERYDRIVEFSGLEDFMEEPVKNYSSGMYVRLGFAVAIHTDPDVLLVDEVLSVGDEAFGRKCLARLEEHLADGGTLLVVSHSLDLVESLCDRVLWLDRPGSGAEGSSMRMLGEPRRVIDAYRQAVSTGVGELHARLDAEAATSHERWGSEEAHITAARILAGPEDDQGERHDLESGEAVTFEFDVETRQPLADFVFGIAVSTPRGALCWGTNTDLAGFEPERFEGRATVRIGVPALRLAPGEYHVDLAVHARNGTPYDYWKRCLTFDVRAQRDSAGVYQPRHRWSVAGAIEWKKPPGD